MKLVSTILLDSSATCSLANLFLVDRRPLTMTCLIISVIICFFTAGCGDTESGDPPAQGPTCSATQLEADMDAVLAQTASDVDFSFSVERQDGRRYNFNRGDSTLKTSYESASTSKLVSAVIILRLVEQGYLSLTDRPQDWISSWPITSGDTLYSLTLAQLLSFTSGLTVEPICLNIRNSNFETCVTKIATANAGNGITPGQEFYYASTHLQVAGLMAIKASGGSAWQDVFAEFKSQTGLFPTATYDLPSSSNPRLAGGMNWTGEEYMAFLKELKNGSLLNAASLSDLLNDHTAEIKYWYGIQKISGKQMNIRSYELSDIEQIGSLFDEFILMNAALAYRDNCRSIYLNWLRSIYDNSDFKVLVVEQKSSIIAFALGMIQSNKPLLLPERIGYIGMFIVHSKFRRRGIGNSLYKGLLDWFVSHQIVEIQLTTEINNDIANAFWKNHGFVTTYEQKSLKL